MQMGADLAYMGTRFINTKESKAPKEYQDMIIDCGATDIVYTAAVSGVSANFLAPSLNAMGITEEMLSRKEKVDFGEELTAHKDEAKAWATIWSAGQGVTTITDSPSVSDLISDLKTEFKTVIEKQYALLDIYK
jgi:nitronate monooxygenase